MYFGVGEGGKGWEERWGGAEEDVAEEEGWDKEYEKEREEGVEEEGVWKVWEMGFYEVGQSV